MKVKESLEVTKTKVALFLALLIFSLIVVYSGITFSLFVLALKKTKPI